MVLEAFNLASVGIGFEVTQQFMTGMSLYWAYMKWDNGHTPPLVFQSNDYMIFDGETFRVLPPPYGQIMGPIRLGLKDLGVFQRELGAVPAEALDWIMPM